MANTEGIWVLKMGLLAVILLLFTSPSIAEDQIQVKRGQTKAPKAGKGGSSNGGDGWDIRNGHSNAPDGGSYNWGTGTGPDGSTISYGSGSGQNPDGSRYGFGWGSSSSSDSDDNGGSNTAPGGHAGRTCVCPSTTKHQAQGPVGSPTN